MFLGNIIYGRWFFEKEGKKNILWFVPIAQGWKTTNEQRHEWSGLMLSGTTPKVQ
jgi:hypothetical protein